MKRRYLITFEFDGTAYGGFQRQKNAPSVQEALDRVLSKVLDQEIRVFGCGRTDAGVHAKAMTAHFDADTTVPPKRLPLACYEFLPHDIAVTSCRFVSDDFNARFDCKGKTYEYLFYVSPVISPLFENHALWVKKPIDEEIFKKASKYLLGEHDFSSFRASACTTKTSVRTIYDVSLSRVDANLYRFSITGNGFLYNMVRIIVGSLIEISVRGLPPEKMKEIIDDRNRHSAYKTAAAHGLYLAKVYYETPEKRAKD